MTLLPRQPWPYGQVPYATCSRCGTERPVLALDVLTGPLPVCRDAKWCGEQVNPATGLDANGDAQ